MFNFITTIAITTSMIGKAGSVEFLLMFSMALPFLLFSYRRDKITALSYSSISILLWFLLYITDFKIFINEPIDQIVAGRYIYPLSIVSTIVLATYQLIHFSNLNEKFYSEIHKRSEDALEASEAKTRFLSTMSHEIRTPLNAIIGLTHILQDNSPRRDQEDNLNALNYSGKILLNLLNNVLDFSKMEATEIVLDPIPTDINIATRQIKKLHEANCLRKNISLYLEIEEDIPLVWIDIVRFNQVINNLVSNAIKFTNEGKVTLKIGSKTTVDGNIQLHTEILDTGIGMTSDQIEKIWQVFGQASSAISREYGGTGLGLSIVKSILESMDSEILLESKVGEGSKFHFTLDLKIASEKKEVKVEVISKHKLEKKKVLLVEDNEINIMVGKQVLENAGIEVTTAINGKEGVECALNEEYDAILMDIQMPVMDGYSATEEIRKQDKETPILALSASVFMEVKERIFQSGMNGFVFKPFVPEDLLSELENTINGTMVSLQ